MLTLYYAPGACSMASHIALEETGAPYQTQINNALRAFMEGTQEPPHFSELINNEKFIAALAERVRRGVPSRS